MIVKTTTEYQLQQKKKKKLYVPSIKKLNINLYGEVSEKVKVNCSIALLALEVHDRHPAVEEWLLPTHLSFWNI